MYIFVILHIYVYTQIHIYTYVHTHTHTLTFYFFLQNLFPRKFYNEFFTLNATMKCVCLFIFSRDILEHVVVLGPSFSAYPNGTWLFYKECRGGVDLESFVKLV